MSTFAGPSVRAILNTLEEPETGTVKECRTQLLIATGVAMQTVLEFLGVFEV